MNDVPEVDLATQHFMLTDDDRNAIISSMHDTSYSRGFYQTNNRRKSELALFEDYEHSLRK